MAAPVPGWPTASGIPAATDARGNPGRMLAGIILIGALIWIFGPARAGTTGAPAAVPAAAAETPVTVSGHGTKNTEPFVLGGGSYTVSWTAQASSHVGCFHDATLEPTSGSGGESIGSGLFNDGDQHSDSTSLYGVAPGRYYVAAISGCSWTIYIARSS